MEEVKRRCPDGYFVQRFKAPLKRVMSDGVCHFKPLKGKVVYCQLINSPGFAKHRGYFLDMGVSRNRYVPPGDAMVTTMSEQVSGSSSSSAQAQSSVKCIDLTQDDPLNTSRKVYSLFDNPEEGNFWDSAFVEDVVGGGFIPEDDK